MHSEITPKIPARDDPRGLFHPDSVTWKINQEIAIALVGLRALLMQVGHPLVGQGVFDHSGFRERPLSRLFRTLNTMIQITFGTTEEAEQAIARIQAIHQRVQGKLSESVGQFGAESSYGAQAPDLLLWVFATLIDSGLMMYELLFRPLSEAEKEAYYVENQVYAERLGVPQSMFPSSYVEFQRYVDTQLAGGTIQLGSTGHELADSILFPNLPLIPRFVYLPTTVFALGLLPDSLRDQLNYKWSPGRYRSYKWMVKSLRFGLRITPRFLRQLPQASRARRRWA